MSDNEISIYELVEKFHDALPGVFKEDLKARVPAHYEDEYGNGVRENPDGTIEVIEEAE